MAKRMTSDQLDVIGQKASANGRCCDKCTCQCGDTTLQLLEEIRRSHSWNSDFVVLAENQSAIKMQRIRHILGVTMAETSAEALGTADDKLKRIDEAIKLYLKSCGKVIFQQKGDKA